MVSSTRRWAWTVSLLAAASLSMMACSDPAPAPSPPAPAAGTSPEPAELADPKIALDATKVGWDSETFSDEAKHQLNDMGATFKPPDSLVASVLAPKLAPFLAPTFSCAPLRPEPLTEVFKDRSFTVSRPAANAAPGDAFANKGADGLAATLAALLAPHGNQALQLEFKVYKVDMSADHATTICYFYAISRDGKASVQQNALWTCTWALPKHDEHAASAEQPAHPLLTNISVSNFEEVRVAVDGGKPFTDCTTSVLGADPSFKSQVIHGPAYWWGRMEASLGVDYHGHDGVAVGDLNGDGLDDLYLCEPVAVPNRLFIQSADGSAHDIAAAAGVDFLDHSASALILDLDSDGDQDLAVATSPGLMILSNDGKAKFTLAAFVPLSPEPGSLSSADYDQDGDLDLYVTRYFDSPEHLGAGRWPVPMPYEDANNGAPNVLLRNDGALKFADATIEAGLDENNRRFSFQGTWEDYDDDGDQDLYVANDFGRNNLYRNDGGKFHDVAAEAGVEDVSAGMGVTWGDVDGDGRMDLHVSNMFSSAGNRVAYQRKFRLADESAKLAMIQRHARGNSLFRNVGDGTFHDISVEAGITKGRWAWGSQFNDFNGDGREDILVASGYVTNDKPHDL